MSKPTNAQKAEQNAQKYFWSARPQEVPLKRSQKAERALDAAKTAKLRALRLAKEQADKEEAEKIAAENPAPKPKSPKRTRAKPVKMVRMIY
jgi:hypothetical protein